MTLSKQVTTHRPVIVVVDDDQIFRHRLCRAFRDRGYEAHEASTREQSLYLATSVSPDLVLLDLKMPSFSGLDLIQDIKRIDSTITVMMLTGYGSIPTALQALRLVADHYLAKPADAEQILDAYAALSADSSEKPTPTTVPSLARVEWEHIQRVLADCEGNISQAAKLLGIHRRSLQRKLSKFPPAH
jgi:two-component system response regulator RegA